MTAKTWLITGCSTGFGRLLVEELLKTDANVVATARDPNSLDDLKNDRLLALKLDVTDQATITAALQQAIDKFGRIDVLVNNAGYGMVGAIEESGLDATRKMFETNVFGLMQLTQAVLPIMRAQKSGFIVNMSSAAGAVSTPGFGMYNATKYAVEGMSEALAQEVAPFGIKLTIIEPGPFRTDFAGRSLDTQPEIADYAQSPVAKTRAFIGELSGKQAGDPVKAAQIIIDLAKSDKPPLRLPLGNSSMDRIKAKLTSWQEEIGRVEQLGRSADYAA